MLRKRFVQHENNLLATFPETAEHIINVARDNIILYVIKINILIIICCRRNISHDTTCFYFLRYLQILQGCAACALRRFVAVQYYYYYNAYTSMIYTILYVSLILYNSVSRNGRNYKNHGYVSAAVITTTEMTSCSNNSRGGQKAAHIVPPPSFRSSKYYIKHIIIIM